MRRLPYCSVYFLLLFNYTQTCNNYLTNILGHGKLHVAALILARGGSKGIKLKNLIKFHNESLLQLSLNAIKKVDKFDSIWVSTDHGLIYQEIYKNNNNINIHWRSSETATDAASSISAVKEFLMHHIYIDVIALIQCTSPFIQSEFLQKAINYSREGKECIFSVTRSHQLRWLEYPNYIKPINFNPKNRPRRQDWRGELIENGMFYFTDRKLISQGYFQSEKCSFVEITKYASLEIDSIVDLYVARSIYEILYKS